MHQLTPTPTAETSAPLMADAPVQIPLEARVEALLKGKPEQRREATQALSDYGAPAIEPLCRALSDKDVQVRLAAAGALAEVGDERAIQPLIEGMRRLFPGHSPVRYRWMMYFLWVATLLASIFIVFALLSGQMSGGNLDFPDGASGNDAELGELYLAYAHALTRIAERSPNMTVRKALGSLRAVEKDALLYNPKMRAASRRAARRIDFATARLQLPVPSLSPEPDAETLPRATG